MKLFAVDWTKIFRDLSRWSALPLAARRLVLDELKPHGYVPAQRFGDQLETIIASGIPAFDADRRRLWVGDDSRELIKVLRAMDRHPVFDAPTQQAIIKYLEDHFTNVDIEIFGRAVFTGGYGYATRQILGPRMAAAGWLEDFLEARGKAALIAWGEDHGWFIRPTAGGRSPLTLERLQELARELMTTADGIPLRELVASRSADAIPALADAVFAGLATGVLFAGMRGADLEPMIGPWPAAVRERIRPPAPKPTGVVPAEQFSLAFGMEDMTTLLATIVAAPVRVRADDLAVFARSRSAIEPRLVALPPWAAHLFVNDRLSRVDEAARELRVHAFVQIREHEDNPHLTATATGKQWLALSPHERLASLIDPVRNAKDENPRGAYEVNAGGFFPFVLPFVQVPKSLRLRQALTNALLEASSEFLPLESFLDYAAREANPLLELPRSGGSGTPRYIYAGEGDPRENYRNLWRNMLVQFLIVRLLRFGGASVGRMATNQLCFALTDVGRYILGTADAFEYGSNAVADIVVQPNFDIVFLGSAPSAEAAIARFAERVGAAPGIAFKITRKSALAAAEGGATTDEMLGALRGVSSKPIPKNVEKEIAGWMGSVRRARLRTIEVIECDGDETAERIVALLGPKAVRVTPTMFELPGATASARAAMIKRLRAGGVFLEDATIRAPSRAREARTRVQYLLEEEEDEL